MSQYSLPPDGFDKLSIMSHFRNFLQSPRSSFQDFLRKRWNIIRSNIGSRTNDRKNSEAIANLWLFPRMENPCSLPQFLDPSIFLAFHATLSSLFAKDFLLQLLAKNAASLHWNRNENLRFLARFQTTTVNLETPVRRRTIHGL